MILPNRPWIIKGNSRSISLLRFYVNIEPLVNDDNEIYYKLDVYKSGKLELTLEFDNEEDAVRFTHEVIVSSKTIEEIENAYNEQYNKEKELTLNKEWM